MKNIYVIGGGTAGWLTAIFAKTLFKQKNITLIESSKIGTIGVGEGTTPDFVQFLKRVGISEVEFQNYMTGTKKVGINFTNWAGDSTKYNHDFLANSNREYAYHFNSYLLGDFFKQKGLERGINYIEDDVINITSSNDIISEIELQKNGIIQTDFVFDCTGFARLLLGKTLKSKWIDCSKYLTTNSAIPFRLNNKEKLTSNSITRTDAITMKNGWMWKVPLQDTTGYGYVFDSNYASDDDIRNEIKEYFDKDIEFKRTIRFKSGYYEKVWIGNCISIGLSGGFFEPLEATSIMTIVIQLNKLVGTKLESSSREKYNTEIFNVNEQILNFIRYHYTCQRSDTKFWKDYRKREMPEKLKLLLDKNDKLKIFNKSEFNNITKPYNHEKVFDVWQYLLVSNGNFITKKELL